MGGRVPFPGSEAAGLAMAVELPETAQEGWRAVNGPHLVERAAARRDQEAAA